MFTFFLDLLSNERDEPPVSMGPGTRQLPGDADGLQHDWAQWAVENWKAGRPAVSVLQGSWHPALCLGCSWASL